MTTTRKRPSNWQIASGAVLAYEGVSAITKAAKHQGFTDGELPFITELIRPLPKAARAAVVTAISVIVWDHFNENGKVFR